jgi:hypothetical protein
MGKYALSVDHVCCTAIGICLILSYAEVEPSSLRDRNIQAEVQMDSSFAPSDCNRCVPHAMVAAHWTDPFLPSLELTDNGIATLYIECAFILN